MTKNSKGHSKKTRSKPKQTTKKKAATSSGKPIADRVLELAKAASDPTLKDRYDAIMGVSRPVDDVLASYTELLKDGAKIALAGLKNSVVKEGADLKLQVSRVAVQPFSDLDFSVVDARKVSAKYGKDGFDGIGAVRFCPVPDLDTGADMIAMDTVVLYTGDPPPSRPGRHRRRAASGDGVDHAVPGTLNWDDRVAIKAALASILYPPLARLPSGDPFQDEERPFAKGSKQAERALVSLMCRSQLPTKKMLIGFGAGKSVIDWVQGHLKYLVGQRRKGNPAVIHQDLVPAFWLGELRRLEINHLSVPSIRLR